ncbi:MAG: FkbM family methyltransferase, partial [Candidatus Eisenbacteria bacterium]|nr:FkbM family methyltransferase [Candidatus Eisenbacteria bacterium]
MDSSSPRRFRSRNSFDTCSEGRCPTGSSTSGRTSDASRFLRARGPDEQPGESKLLAENFLPLEGDPRTGSPGSCPSRGSLGTNRRFLQFARYARGHVPADPAQLPTLPVPGLPADDLLALYGFADVDLIKIDVEGHELQVLEGLEKTLKRSRPVLVVESNTWTRSRFADYEAPLEFLRGRDYALFMFVGGEREGRRGDYRLRELCVADYPWCRERIGSVPAPARIPLSPEERVALMASEL